MANPWYPFYPGDYARDTAHLSMVEDSAYRRLLDHYYSTARPIPTHVEQVFRICRAFVPAEQEAVRSVLREFFVEHSDGWRNKRVDAEIQKANEITEKRSKAGKASAQKRSPSRSTTHEPTHVEQVLTQPQPQVLSPSSAAAGFDFSSENKTLTTSNTRARVYTDSDFLARDLRKLRKAEDEMEAVILAQPQLAPDEIFEMVCDRAGISVADGLKAKEYQRQWPGAERAALA